MRFRCWSPLTPNCSINFSLMRLWQSIAKHWSSSTKVISILLSDCDLQFSGLPMHPFVSRFLGVIGVFTVLPRRSEHSTSFFGIHFPVLVVSQCLVPTQPTHFSASSVDAQRSSPTFKLDDTRYFLVECFTNWWLVGKEVHHVFQFFLVCLLTFPSAKMSWWCLWERRNRSAFWLGIICVCAFNSYQDRSERLLFHF